MADRLYDTELTGTISTPRHGTVRYRAGFESGDLFEEGDNFEGLTLTIEVSGQDDALAMIKAIKGTNPSVLSALGDCLGILTRLSHYAPGFAVEFSGEGMAMIGRAQAVYDAAALEAAKVSAS
jgi:hypothetical protein